MAKSRNKNKNSAASVDESKAPPAPVEAPIDVTHVPDEKPKTPYQDHMAGWESKKDQAEKAKLESSKMNSDYAKHPKFNKF